MTNFSNPSTPLDKVKDISSQLGNLLQHLHQPPTSDQMQHALEELASTPSPTPSPATTSSTSVSDYFTSAKYKDITC
jgi:hypothetical protein